MFEIGSSLREARMRQGFELPEAEAATKIRGKYLRALEEERFELLPSQTYVKGFLRSYAEFLGLDGQLYVDEFNSRYGAEDEELAFRRRTPRPPSRQHRRVESRFVLAALAGIAVLTALVVIAWKWGSPETPDVANLGTAPAATVSAPPETAPAQTARPAAKPAGVDLVIAAAAGNCWVAVVEGSAAGEPLFDGTIEKGTSRRFRSSKRLWLNIGAPDAVVVRLNGKRVDVPGPGSRPVVLLATPKGLRLDAPA